MLRKVLLVLMAVVLSYGLTAFSGYILYTSSEGRSEAHLSIVVRFIASPLIAVLTHHLVLLGLVRRSRLPENMSFWIVSVLAPGIQCLRFVEVLPKPLLGNCGGKPIDP